MNVIARVDFHDNLRGVDRKAGEEFVVTRERYDEINAAGEASWYGAPLVEEVVRTVEAKGVETPESRASKAPAKRRSTGKAK
jgi:hypothetical protein